MDSSNPRQVMRNALFINTGTGRFLEAAHMAGVANSDWTWSLKFGDFDCDGMNDLFITNGMTGDWLNSDILQTASLENREVQPGEVEEKRDRHLAFQNHGNLEFENVSRTWNLDEDAIGFGAAMGDLDNDGDLDAVVNNFGDGPSIFLNHLERGNALKVSLRGQRSNSFGIDALATLEVGGKKQAAYLTLARGFMGCDEPILHFGLGEHDMAEKLTIRWPSGIEQTIHDLPADRHYVIREPIDGRVPMPSMTPKPTTFVPAERRLNILARHTERPFDDFQRQPLLPNKLSQLGPGLAVADANQDGHVDILLSGPAHHAAQLLVHIDRLFELRGSSTFEADAACEDLGCLLFDADNDGDRDLYIVSGGVECEAGAAVLQDRLYVNDGDANFEKAKEALPPMHDSGSCVAAADFDRDGDLDLFVGGRVVPGGYPLTPRSHLLQNNSSASRIRFAEVTDKVAPDLAESGMVTAAIWSDVDNDGWVDLVVTHDWGPVRLYQNQQGKLVDRTSKAGLAGRLGWWNGIAGSDVDGDGDIDFVVTNVGLNTKYHPSPSSPVAIYYGDFEATGQRRIVEAKTHEDQMLPIRGKSCSQNAMPFLRSKFPTYHEFALADLNDIYSITCLHDAFSLEVNCSETGVLKNDGHGHFEFLTLPRRAQVAPSFGAQFMDVNADGIPDICLAQNFSQPQRETGPMRGGLSLILTGNGDGTFTPVAPSDSGIVISKDARSLSSCDINGDGRADVVAGINDGHVNAFTNSVANQRTLSVKPASGITDSQLAGTRVTLTFEDGTQKTAEIYFGDSYLTQTTSDLLFSLGTGIPKSLVAIWADGTQSEVSLKGSETTITVAKP